MIYITAQMIYFEYLYFEWTSIVNDRDKQISSIFTVSEKVLSVAELSIRSSFLSVFSNLSLFANTIRGGGSQEKESIWVLNIGQCKAQWLGEVEIYKSLKRDNYTDNLFWIVLAFLCYSSIKVVASLKLKFTVKSQDYFHFFPQKRLTIFIFSLKKLDRFNFFLTFLEMLQFWIP